MSADTEPRETREELKPEEAGPLSHQVERLIGLYQERMRAAAK